MIWLTQWPAGTTFSIRTYTAIIVTQSKFITPATKSSAIISQQQPTQKLPCRRPMINAPLFHLPHSVIKNPMGERQWDKQVSLRGVNWKIPALIRRTPPRIGLVLTIMGESRVALWRLHWARLATALKPIQTIKNQAGILQLPEKGFADYDADD